MNSRQKGCRGERMLAQVLTEAGFPARRGQQFRGGANSPDVICPTLARWHWEAKFAEQLRYRPWLAQVEGDCGGKPWVISWKRKNGPWIAMMKLDDLIDLIRDCLPPSPSISTLAAPCGVEQQVTATEMNQKEKTDMLLTEAFPSKWLKAADLEGEPLQVTIESVKLEPVEEGKPPKPVVTFRRMTQGLVLNKTNANTLGSFLGADMDNWTGKKIVLFPTQAEFQGRMTDCIRVRAPKPTAPVPAAATAVTSAPAKAASTPARPSKAAEEALPVDNEDDVPF